MIPLDTTTVEILNKYDNMLHEPPIQSHTARLNAYERGTPTYSLMQITGHKTEKSFLKYIKTSKTKHAEIVRKHL